MRHNLTKKFVKVGDHNWTIFHHNITNRSLNLNILPLLNQTTRNASSDTISEGWVHLLSQCSYARERKPNLSSNTISKLNMEHFPFSHPSETASDTYTIMANLNNPCLAWTESYLSRADIIRRIERFRNFERLQPTSCFTWWCTENT